MTEAVLVAATRSPIARAHKGSLVGVRPDDLLAQVFRHAIEISRAEPAEFDDVIVGCAFPYGEAQALNVTRGAAFMAGLPASVPAVTVNRYCSSSLQAVRMAYHAIKAGEASVVLIGGVESVSRCFELAGISEGLNPRFTGTDQITDLYISMGETAENVANRYGVGREEMDRFAQQSQERAVAAQREGVFDAEIVGISTPDGRSVTADDGPRPESTLAKLAQLKPMFRENGRVTAGNSCPLNDGAAAVVVMSDSKAKSLGLRPQARIVATGLSALEPELMGVGPIEAVRSALRRSGMGVTDVGVLELNEAFASQVLAVCNELGIDPYSDRVNPHGGAIALGHPFGMTGARMMTTLLNDLRTLDRDIGIEAMCVGGGQGMAMVVERLN